PFAFLNGFNQLLLFFRRFLFHVCCLQYACLLLPNAVNRNVSALNCQHQSGFNKSVICKDS
ncbi:MAG TPA: hypothetical protein DCZ95_13230, partial [Verrucomicrobia bacterium]|nr:hypothetical protein [Verrucomicrobiota bacterium]